MALQSDYIAGTVSVAAGGTAMTGVGTAWLTAGFQEGDLLIANGYFGIVGAVNSNTSITLAQPWRGTALNAAPYRLRYLSDGSRASAKAQALIELLGAQGNVEAFAALISAANKLGYFNGAGTMSLTDFTALARTLLAAANTDAAQTALGAGATGKSLFTAANATAALSALGLPYEFGSFTPFIDVAVGSFTGTYSAQAGNYVKVGRLVFAQVYIVMTTYTGSGQLRIAGLPVTRAGGTPQRSIFFPSFWSGFDLGAGFGDFYGFLQDAGNTARLYRRSQTGSTPSLTNANITGTVTIYGATIYEAAS